MFHYCRICVTDFKEEESFWASPTSVNSPQRLILNGVNIPNWLLLILLMIKILSVELFEATFTH